MRVKRAAQGTERCIAARNACSATFLQTFYEYVGKTTETLKTMNPCLRGWWKICNILVTKAGSSENSSALQRADGSWAMTPEERADELANTFLAESRLPAESDNQQSEPQHEAREEQQRLLCLRVRTVNKLIATLDEHSGSFASGLARKETFSCRTPALLLVHSLGPWDPQAQIACRC